MRTVWIVFSTNFFLAALEVTEEVAPSLPEEKKTSCSCCVDREKNLTRLFLSFSDSSRRTQKEETCTVYNFISFTLLSSKSKVKANKPQSLVLFISADREKERKRGLLSSQGLIAWPLQSLQTKSNEDTQRRGRSAVHTPQEIIFCIIQELDTPSPPVDPTLGGRHGGDTSALLFFYSSSSPSGPRVDHCCVFLGRECGPFASFFFFLLFFLSVCLVLSVALFFRGVYVQGKHFGTVYEGQCDSWYTNVVLLGEEFDVLPGDKIVVLTIADLKNYQVENVYNPSVRTLEHTANNPPHLRGKKETREEEERESGG